MTAMGKKCVVIFWFLSCSLINAFRTEQDHKTSSARALMTDQATCVRRTTGGWVGCDNGHPDSAGCVAKAGFVCLCF